MIDYRRNNKKQNEIKQQLKKKTIKKWNIDWDLIFSKENKKIRIKVFFYTIFFTIFSIIAIRYYWFEKRWRFIVIHHTASDIGNLQYYRNLHEKRWGELAYHILINNGSSNTTEGQIEYSNLWLNRSHHFSTKNTYLNYFGIAIVLVGDFEKHVVPQVQKETLIKLLANLSREFSIPVDRIIGHREVSNTKCPGFFLNMIEIRHLVTNQIDNLN